MRVQELQLDEQVVQRSAQGVQLGSNGQSAKRVW